MTRFTQLSLHLALAFVVTLITACGSSVGQKSNRPGATDPDAPTEFSTTSTGLKYRMLRKADGPKPKVTDRVLVHYSGWLDNMAEFDSSYGRGEPTSFPLSDVVVGWQEGIQLMGVGGMIELEIPPDLGYGVAGRPPVIPPNATLHFKVELLEIK